MWIEKVSSIRRNCFFFLIFFFVWISFWLRGTLYSIFMWCESSAKGYYLQLLCALMKFSINKNDLNKTTKSWIGFLQRVSSSFTHLKSFILYFPFMFHIPYSICVEDCGGDPLLSSAIFIDSLSLYKVFFSVLFALCLVISFMMLIYFPVSNNKFFLAFFRNNF